MVDIESDKVFYDKSGGGVTVSGGEPLLQHEFVGGLLKACKERGFHTALETSGCAKWSAVQYLFEYVDLVLFDIKCMASDQHKELTGVDNGLILDNARRLASNGARIWLRVPLIRGLNDSLENLRGTGQFAARLGVEKVSILPYHEWGRSKYEKLGRRYPLDGQDGFLGEQSIERAKGILGDLGLRVTVGF